MCCLFPFLACCACYTGVAAGQKIDRAVSGRGTREPEVEEVPEKKLGRATSKHQAIKAQIQEKYSARTAPGVEMATR
ncbi:hypothetical protein COCOBI_02-2400 [Coccomyxa sp. Obi]|nr:hypothetical protein COCOBI_02-2400 [Coccomyxa sp. Obi]